MSRSCVDGKYRKNLRFCHLISVKNVCQKI
jgi:hypothetical protein